MRLSSNSLLAMLAAAGIGATMGMPCTPESETSRKDWADLSDVERTSYTDAMLCLRNRPSVLPTEEFPGVKDRLDDFVATHINYTTRIHNNALLLPWHRHFVYLWEKTLQDECGYMGTVPYWNWPNTASNLTASPEFDGSPTSLSNNGAYENEPKDCDGHGPCVKPTGGGCVTSGPFKDYKIHLGPFNYTLAGPYKKLPADAFDYNPRCLDRSFEPSLIKQFNNETVVDRLLAASDINEFLMTMDPSNRSVLGAHGSGHQTIGGAMADVFASPQDPTFMLHHAMVDRVWTLWQGKDMEKRRGALNGTAVMFNPPEAPLVTLDSVVEFGVLDRRRTVRELMDPTRNDYCYRYD